MSTTEKIILQTLAYSSCFKFALSQDEIIDRLPYSKKFIFSRKKIEDGLKKLLNTSKIMYQQGYYFLEKGDLVSRLERVRHVKKRDQEVRRFVQIASKIPFIKAIAITGSTAVANAKRDDDLDFLLICRPGTLWLSRMIMILVSKWFGKRPLQQDACAWCLNIWLAEDDLLIKPDRRSLYEAYETLQMHFVWDPQNLKEKLLRTNSWLKRYLYHFRDLQPSSVQNMRPNLLLGFINHFFFVLQTGYRKHVFGRERFTLTPSQAFFNETRYRNKVFSLLKKKMKEIGR